MKHMVDDFAVYARQPRPGTMQPVDAGALLQEVLALYDNLRPHVSLSLPREPIVIQGEPTRLRQVLHNLLQNAIDAQADVTEPHYEITLAAHGDEVTLSFGDAGAGFDEDLLRRAFEPYVTTKTKGTGLGLAIVQARSSTSIAAASSSPTGGRMGRYVTLVFPRSGAFA